jgi:hypothetical protein
MKQGYETWYETRNVFHRYETRLFQAHPLNKTQPKLLFIAPAVVYDHSTIGEGRWALSVFVRPHSDVETGMVPGDEVGELFFVAQQPAIVDDRSTIGEGRWALSIFARPHGKCRKVDGARCELSQRFYSSCVFRPYRNMIGMRSSTKHDRILRAAYDRRDVPCQNAINTSDRSTIAIARSTLGSHL